MDDSKTMREMTIKEICDTSRSSIGSTAAIVKAAKTNSLFAGQSISGDTKGEMLANLTLAYRHLEDARMRLGKVLQAMDGGVSVYDKQENPNG